MTSKAMKEYLDQVKSVSSSDLKRSDKIIQVLSLKQKLLEDEELLIDLFTASATTEKPESFLPPDINGFSLYRDPDRHFSMHVFVWAPNVPYPIHDHGAWGIVGLYQGQIEETKWIWQGEEDHLVSLEPSEPKIYNKGEVFHVLPLEEGPHSMKPTGDQTAISIHTYGKPVRKSMLRLFHPSFDKKGKFSYYYTYPLYVYRKLLALDALTAVSSKAGCSLEEELITSSSDKVLVAALKGRKEEY